ncbi:MAG: prepilin-type N-terminal cleavage/methylation domain-containing protein [Caldiserica bacterium]|nr:prepilin-type N-terminal cleavage/methylation domain-containing protein [Caldisericota bacterium]
MRRKGFTLLELVVAMAIVMILLTIAVPRLDRYVARVRLRFAGMTLVQDLRNMQMNAEVDESFYTIVFVTNENRYYFRQGTKSYAPPGTVRTERSLSRYAGFPLAVGKRNPVSAVFGIQTSMVSPVVTMSFNEMGRPAGASGGGHVTFLDVYGDRVDVIVTPVDGNIRMAWVQ